MARPVSRRGEGRERVLSAALDLFASHGVSGTSLQMIAEALGVTKASVYFQFRAKEDIVVAVLAPAMDEMAALVDAVEAHPARDDRLAAVVTGLVDLVVHHRRLVAILRGDPAMTQLLTTHEDLRTHIERLERLLLGPDPSPTTRVTMAMIGGGLMMAGADPELADLDGATLRVELLACAQALVAALPRDRTPG
jgi:AcrR family transcriptional regulator